MKRRHLLQTLPALSLGPAAHAQPAAPWLLCGQALLQLQPGSLAVQRRHALPWRPELPALRHGGMAWLARRSGELLGLDLAGGSTRKLQLLPDLQDLSLSADGAWLLATSAQAWQVVDAATLREAARHAGTGPLHAPLALPQRRSLLLAAQQRPELWELYLDPGAEDFYEGLVHDFRFGEGVPTRGFLGRRRMALAAPALALWQHPAHFHVALLQASHSLQMFNLDARRPAGRLQLAAAPQAACTWQWQGQPVLALALQGQLLLIDFDSAQLRAQQTLGPGDTAVHVLLAQPDALWVQAGQELRRLDAHCHTQARRSLPPLQALHPWGAQLLARSGAHWYCLDAQDLRLLGQREFSGPCHSLV